MNYRGYPASALVVRGQIEALSLLPDDAEEWAPFMRDVIRMHLWMLPAVLLAVRQNLWKTAADPLEQIRRAAGQAGIKMRLNNGTGRAFAVGEE